MRRVNALDLETGICGFTSNNPPPQKKNSGLLHALDLLAYKLFSGMARNFYMDYIWCYALSRTYNNLCFKLIFINILKYLNVTRLPSFTTQIV